jgi:hypothetical protein
MLSQSPFKTRGGKTLPYPGRMDQGFARVFPGKATCLAGFCMQEHDFGHLPGNYLFEFNQRANFVHKMVE